MTIEPITILVIDDARASRDVLATMVEELGHRAITADSGLEGLRLVREAQPSLVLLDVVMPSFDGYKIAAAIKAQPRFVPVILLTALNDIESKRRGQAAGADDFLSKPVQGSELSIRIAAMLRIKVLTDALNTANRRLAELAETDALTNVANRRRFDALYALEHQRATRYRRPLGVLVIDIDHFKRVNDTFGHAAGDEVLRLVARSISETVRQTDHVARYGGEEFVVIVPEVPADGALVLADRLRKRVEDLAVQFDVTTISVTISVGVASWDGQTPIDAAALLKIADDALYQAKHGGRNRVILAPMPK